MENGIVFIYGMGRSGTSLLTKLLEMCGGILPERLLGPGIGNEKGHWEPLDALKINDEFLFLNKSSWYDPKLDIGINKNNIINEIYETEYIHKIYSFLEKQTRNGVVIIKDPRIAGLGKYWLKALNKTGLSYKFIIPVRHPAEVAASLSKRDGLSKELSALLWLKYNLLAERDTREHSRVFVHYKSILNNFKSQILRINIALGTCFDYKNNLKKIEEYLSSDLCHNRSSDFAISDDRSRIIANCADTLYKNLCDLCKSQTANIDILESIYTNYLSNLSMDTKALDESSEKLRHLLIKA